MKIAIFKCLFCWRVVGDGTAAMLFQNQLFSGYVHTHTTSLKFKLTCNLHLSSFSLEHETYRKCQLSQTSATTQLSLYMCARGCWSMSAGWGREPIITRYSWAAFVQPLLTLSGFDSVLVLVMLMRVCWGTPNVVAPFKSSLYAYIYIYTEMYCGFSRVLDYIPGTQMTLVLLEKALFWGVDLQNRGHWGSRYISIDSCAGPYLEPRQRGAVFHMLVKQWTSWWFQPFFSSYFQVDSHYSKLLKAP